jgi:hypothetical protein
VKRLLQRGSCRVGSNPIRRVAEMAKRLVASEAGCLKARPQRQGVKVVKDQQWAEIPSEQSLVYSLLVW